MPDWTFFAPLLAALVAAFLSGYAVNRWKGRQEHLEERFDELCSIISDTATLSSEYWQGSQQEDGMSLREAKIMAALRKIAGLRVLLADYGSRSAAAEIELAESHFLRETTGGEFGVHNRGPELQRIISCQCAASDFIVAVRRARLRDLKGLVTRS